MSVKKLFEKNKKGNPINKYLKKSSATDIDAKIKSSGHLSESVKRENYFLPPIDYSRPENFVKYGSAKKYYSRICTWHIHACIRLRVYTYMYMHTQYIICVRISLYCMYMHSYVRDDVTCKR